jgi:predicted ArsR family transcriptional regulator
VASEEIETHTARAVGLLADPIRRRLYAAVGDGEEPLSRDQAAAAAGISRSLAAYHLDAMVAEALLEVSYARRSGRSGPGAGRTSKLYRRSQAELVVSLPDRDYGLAAMLLADAVDADRLGTARAALNAGARRLGLEAARTASSPTDPSEPPTAAPLRARGYEPARRADGTLRLRNCPFHRLVGEHRDLICGMNLALVQGLLDGLDLEETRAVLDPRPGYCCVAILPGNASC